MAEGKTVLSLSSWQKKRRSLDLTEQGEAIYLNEPAAVRKRVKTTSWCAFISSAFAVPCVICFCILLSFSLLNSGFSQTLLTSGQRPHSAHHARSYASCPTHLSKQYNIFYSSTIFILHANIFYTVHMGFGMVIVMGWTS